MKINKVKKGKVKTGKLRKTPEDDYRRLAERIINRGKGKIKSLADFSTVYKEYFRKDADTLENDKMFKKAWNKAKQDNPELKGGKLTTITRIKELKEEARKPSKKEFKYLANRKVKKTGKIAPVFARRTYVTYKKTGKRYERYVDERGRFVKPEYEEVNTEEKNVKRRTKR